jgi:iron complex outermembrane receptor protein
MNYLNQLVLTGEINDDGAYIRKNSGKSYRTGVELSGGYTFNTHLGFRGNIALSSNKADYSTLDEEGNIITYQNSDISFSPQLTGGLQVSVFPVKNVETDINFAYVGKQFLDNTVNEALSLDNYFVSNLVFSYLLSLPKMPEIEFSLLINNLFNTMYESNGYLYGSIPYYFPQAGINYLAGVRLRL